MMHFDFPAGEVAHALPRLCSRPRVVGARFGVDLDFHIKRFFMGWTLRYEVLKHTKGSIGVSHFLSWNVIPVFAIGAVLGAKVQAQDQ